MFFLFNHRRNKAINVGFLQLWSGGGPLPPPAEDGSTLLPQLRWVSDPKTIPNKHQKSINQWIALRENLNRKPWFLPSNIGLSCKFSHHPILWIKQVNQLGVLKKKNHPNFGWVGSIELLYIAISWHIEKIRSFGLLDNPRFMVDYLLLWTSISRGHSCHELALTDCQLVIVISYIYTYIYISQLFPT